MGVHTWESTHTPQLEPKMGVPCSRHGSHTGQNQQRITCYWAQTPICIPHTHPESQRLRPSEPMGGVSTHLKESGLGLVSTGMTKCHPCSKRGCRRGLGRMPFRYLTLANPEVFTRTREGPPALCMLPHWVSKERGPQTHLSSPLWSCCLLQV